MKLSTVVKTAAFAVTTMLFLGCSDSDDVTGSENLPATGSMKFTILGEDIPYDSLTADGNFSSLKYATIDSAYMIVKSPKLSPKGHESRHVGESISSAFSVDLMAKDANRTHTVLGVIDTVDAGSYEANPSISIYLPYGDEWDTKVIDKGGLAQLKAHGVSFVFGGTLVQKDGTVHKYEVREDVNSFVSISDYPEEAKPETGNPLVVKGGETLVAEFHPHIDHALEVLGEYNDFGDYSQFTKNADDVIIFSKTENNLACKDKAGNPTTIYADMVKHIEKGSHWDVTAN